MIEGGRPHSASFRIVYGASLVVLVALLSWWGLRYIVSHAGDSMPEHLVADIVVPLAQSRDRTAYANMLVRRSRAAHVGSTLFDVGCLERYGPHSACATGVRNTIDEAIVLRRLFEEERLTRAIVVTSPDHVARAAAIFSIIFAGSGINVHFAATPGECPSPVEVAREVKSYIPSVAAAVLARFAPRAYEWSLELKAGIGTILLGVALSRMLPCS